MSPYERVPADEAPTTELIVEPPLQETTAIIPPPSAPPPVVPPRRLAPPGRRWLFDPTDRIGIALLTILLAAGAIILAVMLLNRDDGSGSTTTTTSAAPSTPAPASATIAVPSLAGESRADATSALTSAGLAVVVATVPGPPPKGQVLAQHPTAGAQLGSGAAVRINISDGSQTRAAAPPAATTAQPAITPATTASATTTPTSTTPTSTTPAATTPAATTPAATTAGTSPPPARTVQVPALSGDVKSAVQSLATTGLLASIQYVPGDEPLGTVTAQSPSGGGSAKTGSHVTISVSSGPGDKPQETVPDASGRTIPQAVETLNGAGLRLILVKRTVTDKAQAGQVVDQTPSPGAHAPRNAQVLVYMGAYRG